MRRREFLATTAAAVAGGLRAGDGVAGAGSEVRVVSTWDFGRAANDCAVEMLTRGASPLDAVEAAVMVVEGDPAVDSVGYGGLPNRDGVVELDAAIVDGATLAAGSVAGLQEIRHPVAVARRVMERTPHVLLVGEGAQRFAVGEGFARESLLTEASARRWREWRAANAPALAGHDTIGLVARDASGRMAAACTTSGLAFKLPGRVGDSPLIGHGLYCDQSAGGAAATGVGEEVIRVCGSYQVVEFMRQGLDPEEACRRVLARVMTRPGYAGAFIGFVALRADGAIGCAATRPGLRVAVSVGATTEVIDGVPIES